MQWSPNASFEQPKFLAAFLRQTRKNLHKKALLLALGLTQVYHLDLTST